MKFNKNYSLLLTGQSLANIGDVLYMVSIISIIFEWTGSAAAASFVPFTITTSMFVSSLLTPLLINKVDLKWLLTGSQMMKTGFLCCLGLLILGLSESDYFLIFVLVSVIAFLDGCATPIRQTLIPHYVKSEQLVKANSIAETVTQLIQTVMWFVGSLFLIVMSAQQLIWVVGILFSMASMVLSFLNRVNDEEMPEDNQTGQIKAGWKTIRTTPVLRKLAIVEVLETMAGTVWIAAILYAFVSDALQVDEKWWGFINGSFFFGLILGSIYCIKYTSFIEKRLATFILFGSVAGVAVTVLFSLTSNPWVALMLSLFVGICGQIKNIPQQTIVQTSVTKERLTTVYTSLGAIGTGVFGVSSLIVGVLADVFGVRVVFLISGLLLATASVIIYKDKRLLVKNVMH